MDALSLRYSVQVESGAVPIARKHRVTQAAWECGEVFTCPLPGMLREFVTGGHPSSWYLVPPSLLLPSLSVAIKNFFTRYPGRHCFRTFHTGTAYQNILNGIIEHLSHVEHASNLGGGVAIQPWGPGVFAAAGGRGDDGGGIRRSNPRTHKHGQIPQCLCQQALQLAPSFHLRKARKPAASALPSPPFYTTLT